MLIGGRVRLMSEGSGGGAAGRLAVPSIDKSEMHLLRLKWECQIPTGNGCMATQFPSMVQLSDHICVFLCVWVCA